ncbi:uncharacterized protein [Triticum aestivum]|uniref:uncharacterized protein n=1 Tax=Triticum aestivum TaxID=4565 RepID=UPI001D026104|nr:uncharacterized protein LOC123158347 [Triticum aestivum]
MRCRLVARDPRHSLSPGSPIPLEPPTPAAAPRHRSPATNSFARLRPTCILTRRPSPLPCDPPSWRAAPRHNPAILRPGAPHLATTLRSSVLASRRAVARHHSPAALHTGVPPLVMALLRPTANLSTMHVNGVRIDMTSQRGKQGRT